MKTARACGCTETYPQLVPGRLSHGPGCPRWNGGLVEGQAVLTRGLASRLEEATELLRRWLADWDTFGSIQGPTVGDTRAALISPKTTRAATEWRDFGDISSVPPDRSVSMECADCQTRWRGCADVFQCPVCGEGTSPWVTLEADRLTRAPTPLDTAQPDLVGRSGGLSTGTPAKEEP